MTALPPTTDTDGNPFTYFEHNRTVNQGATSTTLRSVYRKSVQPAWEARHCPLKTEYPERVFWEIKEGWRWYEAYGYHEKIVNRLTDSDVISVSDVNK